MRLTKNTWAVIVGSLVFGMFGLASAQTPAASPVAPEITTQQDVNLSAAEMRSKTDQYLPSMEQGAASVRRQLSDARSARDVVKVLCLNDKLNQIDVAVRTARDRASAVRSAADHNDTDRAKHEFAILQVLRDRVRTLVAEANQCIGEETGFVGESRVTVSIDPNIPDTDPSEFPDNPVISEPPVLSSPTL